MRRRVYPVVIALALLPVSVLVGVGVYAVAFFHHVDTATGRVQAPCVSCALRTNPDTGDSNGAGAPADLLTGASGDASRPAPLPTAALPPKLSSNKPFTVLLIGVDSREGDTDPAHSDTLILAYVDPVAKHVNLMSIPRDLQVIQAGSRGTAKITDVYANGDAIKYRGVGGVGLVWDTLKLNFQINIDYYAQANFEGLTKMVDAVGGVTIDNPYPIKDDTYPTPDYQYSRVYFPAGILHLNGDEALEYARTRHADNDFGRNARQQQVILGIREQAVKTNLASKATDIVDALGTTFRTDLPSTEWLALASFGKELRQTDITQITLTDLLHDSYSTDGTYYAVVDWDQARARANSFPPKRTLTCSIHRRSRR